MVIRGATEHHPVDTVELAIDRRPVRESTVQHDRHRWKIAFQPTRHLVAQRRDFAILFRGKPLQDRVARMDG